MQLFYFQLANLVLIIAWVASIIYAQKAQKATYDWVTDPLSHYLVSGKIIDVGFICLAASLATYAFITTAYAPVFYVLGALGALMVVATKTIYTGHKKLHNISAGFAYGGCGVGNILASLGHPFLLGFSTMAPIVVLSLILMKASTAAQERIVAIVMISWFVAAYFLL